MKLKLIAAAVALVASGSSFATISGPYDGIANTGVAAELFLTVWQQSGTGTGSVNRSFTWDTGVSMFDMQANTGVNLFVNQTVSGSNEWVAFLAAGTGALQYSVVAGDLTDGTPTILSTFAGSSIATKTNLSQDNALNLISQYTGANNPTGTHATQANGASFNISGDEFYMTNGSNTWQGSTGNNSVAVGSSTIFGQMVKNGSNPGFNTINTIYSGKMFFGQQGSDYVLQYQVQAVPEPTGIALALAGFGIVGFVARRRKSA